MQDTLGIRLMGVWAHPLHVTSWRVLGLIMPDVSFKVVVRTAA